MSEPDQATKADEPPAKKKRTADRQITKDDNLDAEGEETADGSFRRADDATLQRRRIVKAKRPVKPAEGAGETAKASSNPFANTVLVANNNSSDANKSSTSKVFGSGTGFGGFGTAAAAKPDDNKTTTSTGFGSSSTGGFGSSSTGGFGSGTAYKGFGTAAKSSGGFGSGFGSTATTTTTAGGTTKNLFDTKGVVPSFGFGSSTTTASTTKTSDNSATGDNSTKSEASPKASPVKPVIKLPDQVELTTGEENEQVLFEVRCKTHVMVESIAEETKESSTPPASAAAPSVPPSKPSFAAAKEDAKSKKEEAGPDAAAGAPTAAASKTDDNNNNKTKKEKKWKEVGVGPLKLLFKEPNKYRLVQRYQGKNPGDQPTKVILNIPIWKDTDVQQPTDKYVQLNGFFPSEEEEGGKLKFTTYSLRVKEDSVSKDLFKILTEKSKIARPLPIGKQSTDKKEEEAKSSG